MRNTFVFVVGVLCGCLITTVAAAGMYYYQNYVVLGGPAGAVTRQYERNGMLVRTVFTDHPVAVMDYAAKDALLGGLLAARAYCHMSKADKMTVLAQARGLESNPSFVKFVANMNNEDGKAALAYLTHADPARMACVEFRPGTGK
jgi:surface antigen